MKAFLLSFLLLACCYFSAVMASPNGVRGPGQISGAKLDRIPQEEIHITLEKTGKYEDTNEDGEFSAGDQVSYTFLVTNTCTGTITDIVIKDPLVHVEGGPVSLAPGQSDSTSFSAVYILTQEDVDAGILRNTATVCGRLISGEQVEAEDEDIQEIYVKGSIKLTKTGTYADTNEDGQPNVGDHVHYTFVVKNSCHATLYDVMVLDTLVTVSGGPITLAPGEKDKTTFTGSYALTQKDIDAGELVNIATAKGTNAHGETIKDTDEDRQVFEVEGAIRLQKTGAYEDSDGSGYVNPGDQIRYTFTVKNSCHVTLTNVHVQDILVEVDGGPITLAPSEKDKTTFKAVYTITQEDIDRGKVINKATAIGHNPKGDEIKHCDSDTVMLQGPSETLLFRLTKSVDVNQAVLGQQISYTITISNEGPQVIKNVLLTDQLPEELTLISSSWEEQAPKEWLIETIGPGEVLVLEITALAIQAGEAINVVKMTVGDYQLEAQAETVVITDRCVDLAIAKSSNGAKIYQGDEFDYVITVKNVGEDMATNVVIEDLLPDLVSYVSSEYQLSVRSIEPQLVQQGNRLQWHIAEFPAGERMELLLRVKANGLGRLLNEVEVSSDLEDSNPADNTAEDINDIGELFVPNVFTPGTRDNVNDYFVIRGLNQFVDNEIVIMNRLGDHVFEQKDYQNDWDANGLNGGAYFYVLTAEDTAGRLHTFKGWVQVIKASSTGIEQ
ncbi:hypothetical protein DN752_13465 [Echinicola strongylocentroti]|uniref:DUF11 domain-containing protein n=1 Tax=Echinicola strongylocentroti TaxID=1795355 RepID=A0A2Z4IK39_9BACT|nr:gliding motility-associated C-terminal domain-containing protein [Echinicola strongylocentroti]AWW31050.1 hypothetical protein DN752_13465 [Echinicola strongylocentroti]